MSHEGTSLAVQGLRLCSFAVGGESSGGGGLTSPTLHGAAKKKPDTLGSRERAREGESFPALAGSGDHPGVVMAVPTERREVRSPRATRLSEWTYSGRRPRREPEGDCQCSPLSHGLRRGWGQVRGGARPQ